MIHRFEKFVLRYSLIAAYIPAMAQFWGPFSALQPAPLPRPANFAVSHQASGYSYFSASTDIQCLEISGKRKVDIGETLTTGTGVFNPRCCNENHRNNGLKIKEFFAEGTYTFTNSFYGSVGGILRHVTGNLILHDLVDNSKSQVCIDLRNTRYISLGLGLLQSNDTFPKYFDFWDLDARLQWWLPFNANEPELQYYLFNDGLQLNGLEFIARSTWGALCWLTFGGEFRMLNFESDTVFATLTLKNKVKKATFAVDPKAIIQIALFSKADHVLANMSFFWSFSYTNQGKPLISRSSNSFFNEQPFLGWTAWCLHLGWEFDSGSLNHPCWPTIGFYLRKTLGGINVAPVNAYMATIEWRFN